MLHWNRNSRTEKTHVSLLLQSFPSHSRAFLMVHVSHVEQIFQLLLPEFTETSDQPMYLLLALCLIAPFWSWGAAMSVKIDPETKNTRAR